MSIVSHPAVTVQLSPDVENAPDHAFQQFDAAVEAHYAAFTGTGVPDEPSPAALPGYDAWHAEAHPTPTEEESECDCQYWQQVQQIQDAATAVELAHFKLHAAIPADQYFTINIRHDRHSFSGDKLKTTYEVFVSPANCKGAFKSGADLAALVDELLAEVAKAA